MRTSESIKELAGALVKAQAAISHVVKDKTGKILTKSGSSYEYNYSDLASVIEAVKKPLNDAGITFVQSPNANADGVTVTTCLLHMSGEFLEDTLFMPVGQATPQAFGSAITYCKRYQLQSLTGLPSEDDDGKKGGEGAEDKPAKPALKPAFAAPHTARDTAVDEYNRMTPEEQQWAREQALELIALHDDGKDMYRWKESQNWSAEEFMAIWSQLPSQVRTKFKKQKVDALSKPLAAELASQP